MKSVGEIMSLGRSFEEVLQKAIRMLDVGMKGFTGNSLHFDDIEKELREPTDKRIFAIAEALKRGYSVDRIHELTKITKWFLYKMKNIVDTEIKLKYLRSSVPKESILKNIDVLNGDLLREAKQNGFSDLQIAQLVNSDELTIRNYRKSLGVIPVVKQIDTTAAEFPAQTNYLYLTNHGNENDIQLGEPDQIIVFGSGPYRIGSSVKFDWCCVNTANQVNKSGYKSIMINCNPETVSTYYDICDKLYFEQLTLERMLDICALENSAGVIVSMGGQIPNNIAMKLHKAGIKIIGISPVQIDNTESRYKFSQILDEIEVDQPEWREVTTLEDAKQFSNNVGYPVLIRPSYVLSGAAMSIVLTEDELELYLKKATELNSEHPVVISKFITDAREIEVDAVADKGELFCYAIAEHVENARV